MLTDLTHSVSDSVSTFSADTEPTDEDEAYLAVPFTRYLPEDDELIVNAVELVRHHLTTDDFGDSGWLTNMLCCLLWCLVSLRERKKIRTENLLLAFFVLPIPEAKGYARGLDVLSGIPW